MPPPSEDDIHIALVQWLLATNRAGLVFHHSPNEGRRGWKAQRWLKNSGTQAGWPDLSVHYRGRTIFLELKSAKGVLSEAQKLLHPRLADAGYPVYLARSFEEATRIITTFVRAYETRAA